MLAISAIVCISTTPDADKAKGIKQIKQATGLSLRDSKALYERIDDAGTRGLRLRISDRMYGRLVLVLDADGFNANDNGVRRFSILLEDVEIARADVMELTDANGALL